MSTENLTKSLIELIDETLDELEEVKKSRMSPEEITMGHSANGEMKKDEDADDDDDKDDKAEKGENPFADKKKDKKDKDDGDDDDDDKAEKSEGVNKRAMSKAEACAKAEAKMKKALAKYEMRKASYEMKKMGMAEKSEDKAEKAEGINRMAKADHTDAFEARLNQLTDLVKKIAETPVPARGQTYRDVQPLAKTDETQPLVKSKVIDELFEMKKSGKDVTAEDMFKAETGGSAELATIANKYGIK